MNDSVKAPALSSLTANRLERMMAAAAEVREASRVLAKAGLNVVGECLRGQGIFYEKDHYPSGDVYDNQSCAQYYYHDHRENDEHGHFHTFLRTPQPGNKKSHAGGTPTHLVAISMDDFGSPLSLFATNRWVTAEHLQPASVVVDLVDRFSVDHAYPNWAVNRWLSAMLALFYPQVCALLQHRDQVLKIQRKASGGGDVFEDRSLEVTGEIKISIEQQIAELEKACASVVSLRPA